MMGCPSCNDISLLDLVGCHNNENGWILVEWFWSEFHVLPFVNINFWVTAEHFGDFFECWNNYFARGSTDILW